MKELFNRPEIAYKTPEDIGKTDGLVGIDFFILHRALWSNYYSKQLQRAGIRYNVDAQSLIIPYDQNQHIQIFNPVATFFDAVSFIGLVVMSENMFTSGKIEELVNNEDINIFSTKVYDEDINKSQGYSSNCSENTKKSIEAINRLCRIEVYFRVKPDDKLKGTEFEGFRLSESTGKIIEPRNIRFIHRYNRRKNRHNTREENTLLFDGDFIKHCHIANYVIEYKKLFELRSCLKSTKKEHELVLGLYLYLLGNKVVDKEKGRFFPISYWEKYFQISRPKKNTSTKESDIDLYNVQMKIYREVRAEFRKDLKFALDKLKEKKLITGWKATGVKKDPRAKTDYVNLAKAKGINVWTE
jgi:hypothetical protein